MSQELDNLANEVAETKAAVRDYIARTNVLIEELRANAEDATKVRALANELDGLQKELAPTVEPAPVEPAPAEPAPTEGVGGAPVV